MSDVLNDMRVRLGADISQFRDAMSQVNSTLDSVADYAKVAAKGLGALAVIGGLGRVASEITEIALAAGQQAEELSQLAQITGRNTQSLQDWDVMLNRVGLSQHDLSIGLKTLSQKVEEARNGAGAASDRFRQMGIDLTKLHSTDDILQAIAERSSSMAGRMEKSAAMTDLLGKMGARLIPAFDGGAQAIEAARKKSEEMTRLSGGQIEVLGKMDDSVDDLRKSWERLGQQFGAFVAPSITMVSDALQWLVSFGARTLKELDTAVDTVAIRFTHLALAVNEAAGVLFSTDVFNGDAWKQAMANIDLIDKEAARLIAKRRELANAPEPKDTRSTMPALQDSDKLLAAARATADAELKINEATYKSAAAQWKAYGDHVAATWEESKQAFVMNDVQIAQAHAQLADQMRSKSQQQLVEQISNYSAWAQQRIGLEKAGSKEREALEGQVNTKLIEMWSQVIVSQTQGDTERIKSAVAVAKARQDAAVQEAEAGYARFQLYQQMTEREKQMDVDRTSSYLALVQAQEGALAAQFQDHRRILDATLAAIQAEEDKELASATITEEQKASIRQKYVAQRLQADNQFVQSSRQAQQTELSDAAKLAEAKFALTKAQYDQEFVLFRDTEGLRAAKQAALTAQYQADLAAAQDNATQRLAVEQNYQAQLLSTAQQFPTFWQQQMALIQQSAVFTWSSITSGFSSSLAGVIQGTTTMAQFFQQALNTMLTAAINLVIQLAAQWVAATLFKDGEDGKQVAAHTAMEFAKTAITGTQEAARTEMAVASNRAMSQLNIAALASMASVATASLAMAEAVAQIVASIAYGAAAIMAATPFGQPAAGALIVATTGFEFETTAALLAGAGVVQAALGSAIVANSIPALADGGIVTGPTLALVGEAGPEAVIPLSQLGQTVSGGTMTTLILELDGRVLANHVVDAFGKTVRMRTGVAFG